MMKLLLSTILATFIYVSAGAQIEDRTETNCNGESESIHAILDSQLPLLIASKGLDCSICMGHAAQLGDFAENNQGAVRVWGAITYTYSSQVPNCSEVDDWVSEYGWESIFSFVDEPEYWLETGTPRYIVIDPSTMEITYDGANISNAIDAAEDLMATASTGSAIGDSNIELWSEEGTIRIAGLRDGNWNLEVFDITGKQKMSTRIGSQGENARVALPGDLSEGIYIVRLNSAGNSVVGKLYIR